MFIFKIFRYLTHKIHRTNIDVYIDYDSRGKKLNGLVYFKASGSKMSKYLIFDILI